MLSIIRSAAPSHRLAQYRRAAIQRLQWPLFILGFSLAYFLAAKLGIATSLPPEGIVILWPPNAIVLLTLVSVKREKWWLFFLATVATEIAADVPDYPLWAAAGYGIVNFSEAAVAAILLSKFSESSLRLVGLRDFILFLAAGPVLASGIAALFGAAIYKLGAPDLDYLHYWRVFWFGDALGLLIVGTTLIAWRRPPGRPNRFGLYSAVEGTALALGLLGAASWAFLTEPDTPRVYLIFPFLLWAALRFGVRGASGAILATVATAIGSAVTDAGPFATLSSIHNVISLQALMAVVALSTFMLAFSTEDSSRRAQGLIQEIQDHKATQNKLRLAHRNLERTNEELDRIVASRTKELERAVARNQFLFRELQHRVKNNLQLFSSLLGLHSRNVSDPVARGKFAEVQRQIGAIAATYNIFFQMESAETVDFCRAAPVLCQSIAGAHGDLVSLSIETSGETVVSADTAVALSLVLNELVTNSIKHAGAGGAVAIAISCRRDGETLLLAISDDGPGFPSDFDLDQVKGFGMRMARSVLAQAGGHFRLLESKRGAVIEISVPLAGRPE